MSIQNALDRLRLDSEFMKNVATWERLPPHPARYAEFPADLDTRLISALRASDIAPLYTHQAAAVEAALAGENVVIVTPGQQVVENLEGDEDPSYGNVLIGIKPRAEKGVNEP